MDGLYIKGVEKPMDDICKFHKGSLHERRQWYRVRIFGKI